MKLQLEGFFPLLTVSSYPRVVSFKFHAPRDSPESKAINFNFNFNFIIPSLL